MKFVFLRGSEKWNFYLHKKSDTLTSIGNEDSSISSENISIEVIPRILGDGSIVDFVFGINYSQLWGGELRLSTTQRSKMIENDVLEFSSGVESLTLDNTNRYEFFLIPARFRYNIFNNAWLSAGAGVYYDFGTGGTKNYSVFGNMSESSYQVNVYNIDITSHLVGPLLDLRFSFTSNYFDVFFKVGIVPIYYANITTRMSAFPQLRPYSSGIIQDLFESPYIFLGLDFVILKYFNFSLYYDFLSYDWRAVTYEYDRTGRQIWTYPNQNWTTHNLSYEVSALLPLGRGTFFQLGVGFINSFFFVDGDLGRYDNFYFIFSAKKAMERSSLRL